MPDDSPPIKAALVDPKRRQVACVLIQAVYGGDSSVVHHFNNWITAPSPNLVMIRGTDEQWRKLAERWNKIPSAAADSG